MVVAAARGASAVAACCGVASAGAVCGRDGVRHDRRIGSGRRQADGGSSTRGSSSGWLGAGAAARRYFEEHVEADAVHEQVALHDLCGAFAAERPEAARDILFGARCCLALDEVLARYLLSCWQDGRPSLLAPSSCQQAV